MTRWLATAAAVTAAISPALAQPPAPKSGMMIIRVAGGTAAATPAAPGAPMPNPQGGPDPADYRSVVVSVPVKNFYQDVVYTNKPFQAQNNPRGFWVSHDFGKTLLFPSARFQLEFQDRLNPEAIIKARHAEWQNTRGNKGLFDLVAAALGHDQVDLAVAYAKELQKAVEVQKDVVPPAEIAAFLAAFKTFQEKIEETLPLPAEADEWKKRLQAVAIAEEKHYAVVHFGDQSVPGEALASRLAELERNYRGFYLLHAVLGVKAQYPAKKQAVVIAKKAADMANMRTQLDAPTMFTDGFYSAAYNLVVLSPERLDDVAKSYLEGLKAEYDAGWSRDNLLKGLAPKADARQTFPEIFRMSTNALVDRALDAEAIHGVVTREANRQLYAAAGLAPRHVVLPRWLDAGFANLLSKPKNPGVVIGTAPDKPLMVCGYASGYGSPNYLLFREWKVMKARQELAIGSSFAAQNDSHRALVAREMLITVLTDGYFAAARGGVDIDKSIVERLTPPPPPPNPAGGMPPQTGSPILQRPQPGRPQPNPQPNPNQPAAPPSDPNNPAPPPTRLFLDYKAQTTAWALAHFVAAKRTDGWVKFLAEMDRLPRDMRLDKKLTVEVFARSFSLMNPELTAIDGEAMKAFALAWVNYYDPLTETWRDIPVVTPPANPAAPAGAGAPPPPPGGPG